MLSIYICRTRFTSNNFFFLNRSKSGRVRSFGRTPVTLRSPQLTSASNRKYHGVIHIIITLTSLVCMLYVWSLLGLKTLKPECFFKLFKFFCFYFFCIQCFDTYDTFYKKCCTHVILVRLIKKKVMCFLIEYSRNPHDYAAFEHDLMI